VTAPRFDELIHPSTRLSIVALLAASDWSDFSFVRDRLDLSDSALSKQLSTLEDAGYVAVDRPLVGRRRRVRARLTATGRAAFDGHVAALRAVIASADLTTANPATADPRATDSAAVDDGQDGPADSASR
jgi:DNA-binding MarR family transcriptional regulator